MFAKYGLGDEVNPMSARAGKALVACIELAEAQGIK